MSMFGMSKSESGSGEGALTSGDGIGLINVGIISLSLLFKFFTLVLKFLYACKIMIHIKMSQIKLNSKA